MHMMHDKAMSSEDMKTVTKLTIVITWWKCKRKISTQRKSSIAVGTEKAGKQFFTQKEINLSDWIGSVI